MKVTDFIITPDWMLNLQLTDKQEKLYALIWGYSRNGRSRWRGTSRELATWLRCSERHAKRLVHELENLGFISHEVIRTTRKTWTEFWAILPDEAQGPRQRVKIDWRGRDMHVTMGRDTDVTMGRDIHVPTDKIVISSRDRSIKRNGGGKNSAPGRAKTTTTTTGFLFEDIELPFQDDEHAAIFNDAWAKLRRQPKWQDKTPDALQIVLDRLASTNDSLQAAWCCLKAVEKGWDTIKDPFQMYLDDEEEASSYIEFHQKQAKR